MKLKIINALLTELETALNKEKQSLKKCEQFTEFTNTIKYVEVFGSLEKDSGYRNGILEAIDIVKRIRD